MRRGMVGGLVGVAVLFAAASPASAATCDDYSTQAEAQRAGTTKVHFLSDCTHRADVCHYGCSFGETF